ncbi:MAG: DNA-3-methyladenine glycosylase I [Pseudomonadota bacterium]
MKTDRPPTSSREKPNPSSNPIRCQWPGISAPDYARYHDNEWGVPIYDGAKLFEKLSLETFQSGLSWLTILRKREQFRRAFCNFDVREIAQFCEPDVQRLLADPGIIRHRGKIAATINNARACIALGGPDALAKMIWSSVHDAPVVNHFARHSDVPSQTAQSTNLAMRLKNAGFKFIGPTTVYALMQSAGLVNDHLVDCHRHAPCARLQRAGQL